MFEVLNSEIDKSINIVHKDDIGVYEARYVQRENPIIYVSSMYGCNQQCSFCHLTTTKQTNATMLTQQQILQQVLNVYSKIPSGFTNLSINFMARGDALLNDSINGELLVLISSMLPKDINIRFKISTIFPRSTYLKWKNLSNRFGAIQPDIYWSCYSLNGKSKQQHMPNATDPLIVLPKLKLYQDETSKIPWIHHCFVPGLNDKIEDTLDIIALLDDYELFYKFNFIEYNDYYGSNPNYTNMINELLTVLQTQKYCVKSKLIDRVGNDVKASCGMFV
jgi:adenine C2-methylase RlmN of 23S rRNA A2503 and tRNA A37